MKIENIEELIYGMGRTSGEISGRGDAQTQMFAIYKEGINISGETWINDDGKIVKATRKMFGMEITTEGEKAETNIIMGFGPGIMIQPWMLALNENFEWIKNTTMNIGGFESTTIERYRVINIEEIDTKFGKRMCYKVEVESVTNTNVPGESEVSTKILEKSVWWIDYNNRILIKMESWMENLKIGSIELVMTANQ